MNAQGIYGAKVVLLDTCGENNSLTLFEVK